MSSAPSKIYLKDYLPPSYQIPKMDLNFDLYEDHALVTNKMLVEKATDTKRGASLVLDGDETLELTEVKIDDKKLGSEQYKLTSESLTLLDVPEKFQLEITTKIKPQENKAFTGLYKTKVMFCTQMEAQGFRRVTYFLDRPDVLSKYTTRITADKSKYPVLLSNGDCVQTTDLENDRHAVTWQDPYLKPCYLFALVAGDLGMIKDTYKTISGKTVNLEIYTDKGNEPRCHHAMKSLKESMKWDEDTYGCEYDLNTYMIVAVEDFNMGAMENKGLNIFNSKYVLVDTESATDNEFSGVQSVIGHEYFHNWSGNRITCRDWFQLSLKEGLTVFRDQEFSSDLNSRPVKRIEDVSLLRTRQFPEDAGGMAHPVRPPSYIAIDNFYTATVYLKGAEVIRMMQTILSRDEFIKGVKKYFELFDGQAVTCDDFVFALEQSSGKDLSQFKLWYSQVGTPTVKVATNYDDSKKEFTLTLSQATSHPVTKERNEAYHIPVRVGLITHGGEPVKLNQQGDEEIVLDFKQDEQSFTFKDVQAPVIPSLFRDFSAPVQVQSELSEKELLTLMAKDHDPFNQWEAAQNLYKDNLLKAAQDIANNKAPEISKEILNAVSENLQDITKKDKAFLAKLIQLPASTYLQQFMTPFQPQPLEKAYAFFKTEIQNHLNKELTRCLDEASQLKNLTQAEQADVRSLKHILLAYLCWNSESGQKVLKDHYLKADNMTDALSAFMLIVHRDDEHSQFVTNHFRDKWKNNSLVMNKWFSAQALSLRPDALELVETLSKDELFDKTNPNKLYSLQLAFASSNLFRFHESSGKGYQMMANTIIDTDKRNPQVAARMTNVFSEWTRWAPNLKAGAKTELERIHQTPKISKNVYEMADSYLKMN